jgi:hypothetical protein
MLNANGARVRADCDEQRYMAESRTKIGENVLRGEPRAPNQIEDVTCRRGLVGTISGAKRTVVSRSLNRKTPLTISSR